MFSSSTPLVSFKQSSGNSNNNDVYLPERLGFEALNEWVNQLPVNNSPAWIGLPVSAETERMKTMGLKLLHNLELLTKSTLASADYGVEDSNSTSSQSMCYKQVLQLCEQWIQNTLPSQTVLSQQKAIISDNSNSKSSKVMSVITRFMNRELYGTVQMLSFMLKDVEYLKYNAIVLLEYGFYSYVFIYI